MPETLDDLKFTLTGKMTYKLLEIVNLKKELELLKEQMSIHKNTIHYHTLNNSTIILEKKIKNKTREFIKEFQEENSGEISKYHQLKDKV